MIALLDTEQADFSKRNRLSRVKALLLGGVILNAVLAFVLLTPLLQQAISMTWNAGDFAFLLNPGPLDAQNASAVFNTVNGVLKQKDNDLNPVGVSFFPATIPAGTFLYHANWNGSIPQGLEWVALDWEFSYGFAGFPRRDRTQRDHYAHMETTTSPGSPPTGSHGERLPWRTGDPLLLTFKALKNLDRLIYLDGASAAKAETGEMDQQFILAQTVFRPGDRVDERELARRICAWGKPFGLDGVVRLELGYEVIICDFKAQIRTGRMLLHRNQVLKKPLEIVGFPLKGGEDGWAEGLSLILDEYEAMSSFEHLRAGALVYNRERKIIVDYSQMETLLNKTWISPDTYTRRIYNVSDGLKTELLGLLERHLLNPAKGVYPGKDWQLATERIVETFGPLLLVLNQTYASYFNQHESIERTSLTDLAKAVSVRTFTFIRRYAFADSSDPLESLAQVKLNLIDDYAGGWVPPLRSEAECLVASSLNKVMDLIATELISQFEFSKGVLQSVYAALVPLQMHRSEVEAHFKSLVLLIDTVAWGLDYRCDEVCGWDQICYIPSWGPSPFGWVSSDGKTRWGSPNEIPRGFEPVKGGLRIKKKAQCIGIAEVMAHKLH